MRPFRPAALAVAGLLALSACASTSTAPQSGTGGSTAVTAATSPPVVTTNPTTPAPRSALTFPPKTAGEIARVTFFIAKGVSTQRRELSRAPTKGSYVVQADCSALRPGVTMTYQVFEPKPRTAGTQRITSSGEFGCDDGKITVNSASPFGDSVQIRFTNISDQVIRAYALIIPEPR
jgi:hypothetical protein